MSIATNQNAELKPPTAQLVTPEGIWRLAVNFHWRDDRFEHRVVAVRHDEQHDQQVASDSSVTVLPLAKISDDQRVSDWPINPPLQQLDECTFTGGRRGLVGLGMAGTSHWSLAVEAYERQLWFDIACRIQRPPDGLQSWYELAEPFRWAEMGPADIDRCRVAGPMSTATFCELHVDGDSTEIVVDRDLRRVRLRPRQIPDRLPGTVRWRYGWIATA